MSDQASTALSFEYRRQFIMLAQQMRSQLEMACQRGPTEGEKTKHDTIGSVSAVERTTRHQDTPYTPTPHGARWSVTRNFMAADLYDKFDIVRSKVEDPRMAYARAQVAALNREKDDLLLSALNGSATTGQTGTGTQALPSAQKVSVSSHTFDEAGGSGNAGLTYYKILEGLKVLEDAHGNIEGRVHGVFYGGLEKNTLIATTKTSSTYYVPEELAPFASGKINTLLGVQWHMVENSLAKTDGSSNRLIYLWLEDGLALDMNADLITRIDERSDKAYSWQIFTEWMLGAVRLDDEKVVEIACHPTTLF